MFEYNTIAFIVDVNTYYRCSNFIEEGFTAININFSKIDVSSL